MANKTKNLGLPLGTLGHVEMQNSYEESMKIIDATVAGESGTSEGRLVELTAGRTLAKADAGKYIRVTDGSANNITVPKDEFAAGDIVTVRQSGAGTTTLVAASDVTLAKLASKTLALAGNGATATLVCVAANTFDVFGDLASA